MKIAPSILACDFSQMVKEVEKVSKAGADLIHLDVMDGLFVPNISFGPAIIKSLRKYSSLPFDVHLMIDKPHRYIKQFADAGADIITFHVEAEDSIKNTIKKITELSVKPGLVVKPNTPIETVFPYLDSIYMVLIMTVEPGFGGQSFMHDMMEKVIKVKKEIKKRNLNTFVEVDGGINSNTVEYASKAGVDICVAGTSVFNATNTKAAINELKTTEN